jgi:hypothetical protein
MWDFIASTAKMLANLLPQCESAGEEGNQIDPQDTPKNFSPNRGGPPKNEKEKQ